MCSYVLFATISCLLPTSRNVFEVTTPSQDNTWQKKALPIGAHDDLMIIIEVSGSQMLSQTTSWTEFILFNFDKVLTIQFKNKQLVNFPGGSIY